MKHEDRKTRTHLIITTTYFYLLVPYNTGYGVAQQYVNYWFAVILLWSGHYKVDSAAGIMANVYIAWEFDFDDEHSEDTLWQHC